jgi:hypothetical protein
MQRVCFFCFPVLLAIGIAGNGCAVRHSEVEFAPADLAHFEQFATEIEFPDVDSLAADQLAETPPPITLRESVPPDFRDITLEEAIRTALTTADAMRDLQGKVLLSPENLATIQGPAIRETDPLFGVEAALAEFDAVFSGRAFFEKNDRALNNVFFGGGTRLLTQDLHHYSAEITKRTATGTSFAIRHNIFYDFNNSPGNDVPNRPWDVNLEAEFRQPLCQGAGVEFNRIAGPNGAPGRLRGVLLARLNTDIGLAEFEIGVRDFVSDVENAYWELYFAYRDLDARIGARDRALETWRRVHTLYVNGRRGGEAENEAQAREQYFRLQAEVENALSGRILERSRYDSFRGTGGVYATERRLRRLMGIPISDGCLLRPADEPVMAKVVFDWHEIVVEALMRRAELRRKKWQIKRTEMELIAARNFLKPRLDAVGRYRWRGLGSQLLDPNGQSADRFDSAYGTLTSGDFQEWQLGVELTAPFGFRQAHADVRNAELRLTREKAVLREQEQEIVHDLSTAFADVERSYLVAQTNYNRRLAAKQQLDALEAVYEDADQIEKTRLLDLLLDAQRRLADAESNYYRAVAEHALAIKTVHLQKGSLLDYNEIYLVEGPWPGKALYDACRRERLRSAPRCLHDFRMAHSPMVSQGPYLQDTVAPEVELLPADDSGAPAPHPLDSPHELLPSPAPVEPETSSPAPSPTESAGVPGPKRLPEIDREASPFANEKANYLSPLEMTTDGARADRCSFQTGGGVRRP